MIPIKAWRQKERQNEPSLLEKIMFGFIGSHFDVLVLTAFGLFAATLGGVSISNAFARRA